MISLFIDPNCESSVFNPMEDFHMDRERNGLFERGNGVIWWKWRWKMLISKSNETVFSHKLKNMALRVIAESLSEEELAGYNAQITFEELKAGLKRVGANLKES
ncbi:hypothetical protein L1987_44164 [Smallanthus sonchifolius]|uniref:Uncharacterized protein n=1 Tax=Smallanthus sonchifolius TaxID=185202 RepID=A0ACB9GPF2_9ASTR|nr:hypothetical protein L1987_44164 [Smallanthus sonchifolius]